MESKLLDIGRFKLHYRVEGEGSQYLIAFHGYGQDLSAFAYFKGSFLRHYRVVLVDMFYHGRSMAKTDRPISNAELLRIVSCIAKTESFENFSVAGYSLGGKVALKLIEIMPDKLDEVYLLAPDGLEVNRWYNIATNYRWANRLFKRYIVRPRGFFRLVKVVTALRLISKGMNRFVTREMDRASKRLRVYKVWMLYRDLVPDLKNVSSLVKGFGIRIEILIGEYDRVIAPSIMKNWRVEDEPLIEVNYLPVGHDMFKAEVEDFLMARIKKGATSAPSKDSE